MTTRRGRIGGEGDGRRKRKERPPHRLVPIFAEIVDDIYRRLLKSWILMDQTTGKESDLEPTRERPKRPSLSHLSKVIGQIVADSLLDVNFVRASEGEKLAVERLTLFKRLSSVEGRKLVSR